MAEATSGRVMLPGVARWPRASQIHGAVSERARWVGIALMGAGLVPLVAELPLGLALLMAVNCVIVLLLAGFIRSGKPMRTAVGVISSIGIAGASFSGMASSMPEMAVAYATLLLAMKTMEIRRIRDLRVTAIMSIIPPLICLVSGTTLLAMISTVIVVPVALGVLVFVCDTEAGQVSERGAIWRYPLRGLVRLAWALPLALLMFFLLPRLDNPLWGRQKSSAATGMSQSMAPGNIDKMLNNPDMAFRALFDKPTPVGFQPYWRGPVLTKFDGTTWSIENRADDGRGAVAGTGEVMNYSMSLEPQTQDIIPALDIPLAAPGRQAAINRDLSVASMGRFDRDRVLRMSAIPSGHNTATLGDQERAANLALPAGFNPRAVAMGKRLRAQSRTEERFIQQVGAYFRAQLTYTLEPPLLGRNRVDELLFQTHEGFCEHFASSFAVLMRAGGVPTRVVVGYQGGERNERGDFYAVRQLYAHAWTEVWREGRGWERIDPTSFVTSQRPIDTSGNNPFLKATGMVGVSRWLREFWGDTIGDFDANSQRYIAQRILSARNEDGEFPEWIGRGLMSLGGLLAVALILLLWLMRRRKPGVKIADPLEAAWQRAVARLRKRIGGLEANLTAQQATRAARRALAPGNARTFAELAARYSAAQYAPGHSISRVGLRLSLLRWRPRMR